MEPDGDESCIIEDNAFSKATRKSFGYPLGNNIKSECVSRDDIDSQSESDSDIIISDEEDSEKENVSDVNVKQKNVSSQPLRETISNTIVKEEFNNSISEKLSSTIIDKDANSILDSSEKPIKVSKAYYLSAVSDRDVNKTRLSSMRRLLENNCKLFKILQISSLIK
jgi:hypothetical protein